MSRRGKGWPGAMSVGWPAALWVVRHGESAGNVARDEAESSGRLRLDIADRDMDVPLSERGERQAAALGDWFAGMRTGELPTYAVSSPYVRARQTGEIALAAAGLAIPVGADERLREREFGVLDGYTQAGINEDFPDEAERRRRLGKFYHRPPGGESWADVVARVRSTLHEIRHDYQGERVLIVAHQVVVLLVRYLLEHLDEQEILAVDREAEVANCSLSRFVHDPDRGSMVLERWNETAPVEAAGEQVTDEPDVAAGSR